MYCMYCGEEIPDNSRYCKYCGKKVAAAEDTAAEQTSAAAEPHIAAYTSEAAIPVREEYNIIDGFFFKGIAPFNKFLLIIAGAILMLLTAALVFIGSYPDLVTEVMNTLR